MYWLDEFTPHTSEINNGPHFLTELPEFICSNKQRYDLAIKSPVGSILTAIEVCSGNSYENCLKMCALRGIDIFRYYKNFGTKKAEQVTTMLLPKYSTKGEKTLASMIIVEWISEKFRFEIHHKKILSADEVKNEVRQMITDAEVWVTPIELIPQKLHCLALSEDELMPFGDGAVQVHSHQAVILVRNNSKYYKFLFNLAFTYHLSVCVEEQWNLFLFPTAYKKISGISGHKFFEYPDDAASCLPTLIEGVILAIESLHAAGYAHLDIRLPNICFRADGTAVLIDLDNYEDSSLRANFILRNNSVMYNYHSRKPEPKVPLARFPEQWTVKNIDFRQLGIIYRKSL